MKQRFITLCVAISLLLAMLPHISITANAESAGSCGDNLSWVFDYKGDFEGILTITGTGNMDNYQYTGELPTYPGTPWTSNRGLITEIIIESGVTSVGSCAFAETNVEKIAIPASVVKIGKNAFDWCYDLEDVYFSGTEDQWCSIDVAQGNECLLDAEIHYAENEGADRGSEETDAGQGYIPAVLDAMEEAQSYSWGDGYGALYDIDGNGIEELIMVYSVNMETDDGYGFPAKACSLYTMSNGSAIQLIDKEILFAEAGGPSGHAAVVKIEGNSYFAITAESGETGGGLIHRGGDWKVYTIDGITIELDINVEYEYYEDEQIDYDRSFATINGNKCSYREYEEWENGLENILRVEPYGNGSTMTLEELLEYLKNNPIEESENRNGLVVYSDYTNLSIRKGSTITLSAGILTDGELAGDVSGITFQIEDTSILSVSTTDIKDNCRYVKLKGLAEGTTTVVFNDSTSGYTAKVLVTVYNDNYLSYTLNSVPTQNIEKYPTNVYNVNGLYIDSYKYTVNDDQSATVSFDVYNTNYTYGVVEVFDENGNMKDAVLIEKMTSSNTSIKEAVWDNIGYLVRDIIDGDLLSYRQESGYTKKTSVSVKIPQNGYIKICTDPENSLIVGLVNSVDGLMSMASLAGDIKDFEVNSQEFSKKLTMKLLTDQMYVELIKDGSDAPKDLWKNVGKETFITSESMGSFTDTITKNIDELKLGTVIADTATDFGWDVGENVFTYFAGPAGTALNVMFTIGKVENLIIQQNDLIQSAGVGSIYIQNQGGGLRACQQIKVESEDGFAGDTALNVFSVTLESDVLDIIEKYNPDIYEQIVNGVTYTYNISLMKDGSETQPNGEVTVYIPIPDELKALAYAGDWIDGVPVKVKIYRIEEDGTLTEMDVRIEDGCFVFTTNHFSLYTIVGYDSGDDTTPNQDENGLSTIAIIGIAVAVIVGMGATVIIKRKKNRSH